MTDLLFPGLAPAAPIHAKPRRGGGSGRGVVGAAGAGGHSKKGSPETPPAPAAPTCALCGAPATDSGLLCGPHLGRVPPGLQGQWADLPAAERARLAALAAGMGAGDERPARRSRAERTLRAVLNYAAEGPRGREVPYLPSQETRWALEAQATGRVIVRSRAEADLARRAFGVGSVRLPEADILAVPLAGGGAIVLTRGRLGARAADDCLTVSECRFPAVVVVEAIQKFTDDTRAAIALYGSTDNTPRMVREEDLPPDRRAALLAGRAARGEGPAAPGAPEAPPAHAVAARLAGRAPAPAGPEPGAPAAPAPGEAAARLRAALAPRRRLATDRRGAVYDQATGEIVAAAPAAPGGPVAVAAVAEFTAPPAPRPRPAPEQVGAARWRAEAKKSKKKETVDV